MFGVNTQDIDASARKDFHEDRRRCLEESAPQRVSRCQTLLQAHAGIRALAIAAPSARVASLAQTISGSTAPNPAKVEKPQSVPAITRPGPTRRVNRSIR